MRNRLYSVLFIAAFLSSLSTAPAFAQQGQTQPAPQDGVQGVGAMSGARKLVSAEQIEAQSAQEYKKMLQQAASQRALAPDDHPETIRLRDIARRLIPHATKWNERSPKWQWEVNLIGSKEINAFCMAGGKIAFYSGILSSLKLTDDEVATIMGHEIAHALREHGRERAGKQAAANIGIVGLSIASQLFGLGDLGGVVGKVGAQAVLLKHGREDESEADLIGMDLAARAGYDPRAGIALWQKMGLVTGGSKGPEWLLTHPKGTNRIADIQKHLKEVMPLYAKAKGVSINQLGPYNSNVPQIKPIP